VGLLYSAVTEAARFLWEPAYILLLAENRSKLVIYLLFLFTFFLISSD